MTTPPTASPSLGTPETILRRLDWHVVRRLDGLFQGDYRTLFYGQGVDFADLREYQPNDDVRHIDWNVTARMDAPYVRQYLEDREVTAWFLLDLSPLMAFGSSEREKRSMLIDFVTVLTRVLTRSGNRVGALLYNNRIEQTIAPAGGTTQVLRITNELIRYGEGQGAGLTDLTPLLTAAHGTVKRRSLIFIISDFIGEPGWERSMHLLSQRHELIAIRLFDPRELDLPDVGVLAMRDAETGEQLLVDTSDRRFRQRFAEVVAAREAEMQASFQRANIDALTLSTDDDLVEALVRFATLRKRFKRAR